MTNKARFGCQRRAHLRTALATMPFRPTVLELLALLAVRVLALCLEHIVNLSAELTECDAPALTCLRPLHEPFEAH